LIIPLVRAVHCPHHSFFLFVGADYGGRKALRLAASERQSHIVEYLIAKGVNLNPIDRWGGSPLGDARRNNHEAVINMLETAMEESGTRVVA